VKRSTSDAFENQDYPFDDLLERIAKNKDKDSGLLFNVTFDYQKEKPVEGIEDALIRVSRERASGWENSISNFGLCFRIFETGNGNNFEFAYTPKLFKKETVKRFVGYFKDIVSHIAKNKDIKLKDISMSHDLLSAKLSIPQMEFKF
jgi:hypothetical protein